MSKIKDKDKILKGTRVQKSVIHICVFFVVLHTGSSLPKSPLASLSKRDYRMRLGAGKPGWAVTFRTDTGGLDQSGICGEGEKRQATIRTNLTQKS